VSEDVTLATVSSDVASILATLTLPEGLMELPFSSHETAGEGSPDAVHEREAVVPSRTIVFMGSKVIAGVAGRAIKKL